MPKIPRWNTSFQILRLFSPTMKRTHRRHINGISRQQTLSYAFLSELYYFFFTPSHPIPPHAHYEVQSPPVFSYYKLLFLHSFPSHLIGYQSHSPAGHIVILIHIRKEPINHQTEVCIVRPSLFTSKSQRQAAVKLICQIQNKLCIYCRGCWHDYLLVWTGLRLISGWVWYKGAGANQ